MLKLFRRHVLNCPHQSKGRAFKKCGCPLWAEGTKDGRRIRKSLDTANWEIASDKLLKIDAGVDITKDVTPSKAVEDFLADCKSRNLGNATQLKYRQTLNPLSEWAANNGISTVRALLTVENLKKHVATLTNSPLTLGKKIEQLRTFNTFCLDLEWCDRNIGKKVKKPIVKNPPVVPFTQEQHKAILEAVGKYPTMNSYGHDNRARVLAFVLTLRYTALRISDVVKLRRDAISKGRLLLHTTKTGATIHLPLPKVLLKALRAIENDSPYFFWSGKNGLKAALNVWGRSFAALLKLADVEGHPHMYRHMMAIELLEKGVTIEHVAAILGNSPAIVYKHYAPWVASRQKALDKAVMQVWESQSPE
jgi:site-specific recombinase XerD